MIARSSLLGALALASFAALAGCSAPSQDAAVTTGESKLTERKVVSQTTFVTGSAASYQSDADASLAAACADAGAKQQAIAGAKFLDAVCGPGANISTGTNFLMGATLTTRFVVDVVDAKAPASVRTTSLTGDAAGYLSDATASWTKACAAELERAKTLFSERLLGGGCDAPKNVSHGTNFIMGSAFHAFLLPGNGARSSSTAAVVGASASYESDGLAAWKTACESWGKSVVTVSGAHLVTADCGEPRNISNGTNFIFGSVATIAVEGDDAKAPAASAGLYSAGAAASYLADGLVAWQTACTANLGVAKELLGDRLLAGGCGAPKQLSTGTNYIMGASSPIIVASAGATKITLEGYVFSESASYFSDAQASIGKTSVAAIRNAVARVGATRVEGFEVGEAKNVSSGTNYILGAKTTLLLGVDLPEASQTLSQPSTVKGERASYQADAAASWAKACEDAIDKSKTTYGTRFLAASCGEPTYDASGTYSSPFTTWLVL
ncbi:MAG: hypothetical protein JWO86_643 [Myxococcaceae bacterium]|nr:hypothetical protein [Myxococcaceae bacterium]